MRDKSACSSAGLFFFFSKRVHPLLIMGEKINMFKCRPTTFSKQGSSSLKYGRQISLFKCMPFLSPNRSHLLLNIECVHDDHVGGPKQYNDFPLGNIFYFYANIFYCFSPPTWPPCTHSIEDKSTCSSADLLFSPNRVHLLLNMRDKSTCSSAGLLFSTNRVHLLLNMRYKSTCSSAGLLFSPNIVYPLLSIRDISSFL